MENLSFGQRLADIITSTLGSWRFIIIQSTILATWILLNISAPFAWDLYPFICLNLALSFQAAYSAPIIMMSQNRQSTKDRQQADRIESLVGQIAKIEETLNQHVEEQRALLAEQTEMLKSLCKEGNSAI